MENKHLKFRLRKQKFWIKKEEWDFFNRWWEIKTQEAIKHKLNLNGK